MQRTVYNIQEVNLMPNLPGVYQFFDAKHCLLYVGKAKDVRQRVRNHFSQSAQQHPKTRRMVARIHSITCTIVNTESEALLLENNLIKQHQPLYNALLRDDKTYPYLCLTHERFPRLIPVRQRAQHQGTFWGPYTDVKAMHQVRELVTRLCNLRTCSYQLTEANITKKKFKVCLEYHMNRCQGPCEGLQSEADYMADVAQARLLLQGNFSTVKRQLRAKMKVAASLLKFEQAQVYKDKIQILDQYYAKSSIVNPRLGDLDVCAIAGDAQRAFISYLQVRKGLLVFSETRVLDKKLEESNEELFTSAVHALRECHDNTANRLLTNLPLIPHLPAVAHSVPRAGDKKRLVDIAYKNALLAKQAHWDQHLKRQNQVSAAVTTLQQDLRLKCPPQYIECFDNSNLHGQQPVAAMVCFRNGKPAKGAYRHFHIKTVVGANDYASMHEVLRRRYAQLVESRAVLPDLIVIDGGKGQLNAAVEALQQVGIYGQVAIISIAKRMEEIYYPSDPLPLHLSKQSMGLRLLQRVRDEAHRFAITFHRKVRSKTALQLSLGTIPGIGPATVQRLLQHFGSPKAVYAASWDKLAEQIGPAKARRILEHKQ